MPAERYDVVVIGGGPNGLTAAAYLQRAGASVVVLDKRFEWGGTMATDDYSTPFFYDISQFAVPLGPDLPPYRDLGLDREGLRMIRPEPVAAFVPADGGEPLVVPRNAEPLRAIREHLETVLSALPPLFYLSPMPVEQLESALAANTETKLAVDFGHFTPASLSEELDDPRAAALARYLCGRLGFVEDDQPLGLLGATALALELHPFLAYGGTKALADALFRAGARAGAQYRTVADVLSVERRGEGFVVGCHDGREYEGRAVVSTLDPQSTFTEILDAGLVPAQLREVAETWRSDPVGPFTAHFGLKGEPPRPEGDLQRALYHIVGYDGPDAVVAAQRAAADGQLPERPAGELTVVTDFDSTQAAPGPYGPLHTLRFETPSPYRHPAGDWDHQRPGYRDRCWELIAQHTQVPQDTKVLFSFADGPEDITRRFRTTRAGTPRQGALVAEQAFAARPHPDASDCRTPIERFYLGGGSVHPGIPGTLAGGYNAARAVCEDMGFEHWWPTPTLVARAKEEGVLPRRLATA